MGIISKTSYKYNPSWIGEIVLEIARDCWRWMEISGGTQTNPVREASILGGVPLPPIPGLRGECYDASTRVDEPYNDIGVGFCTAILWTR